MPMTAWTGVAPAAPAPSSVTSLVHRYTTEVLRPLIALADLQPEEGDRMVADIGERLGALLLIWPQVSLRQVVLAPYLEEARVYAPQDTDVAVRQLVVAAVRNSRMEDSHSSHSCRVADLSCVGTDRFVRALTKRSAQWWDEVDLDALDAVDIAPFAELESRYPLTWRAFEAISELLDNERYRMLTDVPFEVLDLPKARGRYAQMKLVESGMAPWPPPLLADYLVHLRTTGQRWAFFPSFKGLSRNPEVLWTTVETLLSNHNAVVTPNYMLTHDRVCQRVPLLHPVRSSSVDADLNSALRSTRGCTSGHRKKLAQVLNELQ